ncbi:MAG: M18 family aminopeptidase [Halioglobus sp.]|nr:M18 family aminopeptidase [Halioglobus sp.]
MNNDEFNADLIRFLARATTPFHAVAEMSARLLAAGFTRLYEDKPWPTEPGGRYFSARNGSSIIAFISGSECSPESGVRIVGAHTDSPCLMLKPAPELQRNGYRQLGVQVYGGALLNPWFDRDLSLAGRVTYADMDGGLRSALIDYRRPVAVIPSLAIHLDREANASRSVNAQSDIVPLLGMASDSDDFDLRAMLRERLQAEHGDIRVASVLDYELNFYDTQPPALVGLEQEFIASARLDNLLSCYTAMQALLQANGTMSSLLVCNDHEEVGSQSAAGAQGPFLRSVLRRLAGSEQSYTCLTERSMVISADNAHGLHPNFPDKHDEKHGPLLNGGPVIKVNASQRYASNSETSGFFRQLCAGAGVAVQSFVVRNDMACGSTIGPITAGATGIRTLDVGVPTFAMHSVRELAGARDAQSLASVLQRFYDHPGPLAAG